MITVALWLALSSAAPDGGAVEEEIILFSSEVEDAGAPDGGEPAFTVVIEEGPADGGQPAPAAALQIEEEGGSSSAPPPPSFEARPFGEVRLRGDLDTWPDPTPPDAWPEQVADARSTIRVGLEARSGQALRFLFEARARWFGSVQADLVHPKVAFEAELGEAYVDWYSRWVDVRAGQQIITAGANAIFAPQDVSLRATSASDRWRT